MADKHDYLRQEDYYESRSVGSKACSDKRCEHCGGTIPKGEPHTVHTFYPEFSAYPTHDRCSKAFEESLLTDADFLTDVDEDYITMVNTALENDELVLNVKSMCPSQLSAVKFVLKTLHCDVDCARDIVERIFSMVK